MGKGYCTNLKTKGSKIFQLSIRGTCGNTQLSKRHKNAKKSEYPTDSLQIMMTRTQLSSDRSCLPTLEKKEIKKNSVQSGFVFFLLYDGA